MNRANVYVKYPNNKGLYLYTQSKGTVLPKIVQRALNRGRDRWGDTASLARIIFSEMIQGNVLDKTGYAISPVLMDNEQWIISLDDTSEKIGIFGESGVCYREFSFNEFCALKEADLEWGKLQGRSRFVDDYQKNLFAPDPYPFPSDKKED